MLKVLKFGGSSMADAHQLEKVRSIVEADPARRVVVVSAAGKRFKDDHKITDLLYLCHAHLQYGVSCDGIFDMVRSRYLEIRDELGLTTPLEAEFDALRAKMEKLLRERRRLCVVRVELSAPISGHFAELFRKRFDISGEQIFVSCEAPLCMDYAFSLGEHLPEARRAALSDPPFTPQQPAMLLPGQSLLRAALKRDLFLSYPYESMEPFLQMVREAANAPDVLSIRITIYRLARKAKLVDYLCAAAENGKDVSVLIELRARFDEQNNIDWSERLEEAGCKVLYGFEDYKVHSKICLITLRERGALRHVTQIGTGNYNEKTAKQYTDVSLVTADPSIGADAAAFFSNMALGNLEGSYGTLLVAPHQLKKPILARIEEQTALGPNGYILMKFNSLTDIDVIHALSRASQAGVRVELIIRGICCLAPGVPGYTDNITVTSIVGRFLEHSRIFCFGRGEQEHVYISSADMMTRNTVRRVEIACPIRSPEIRRRLHEILDAMLADTVKARVLLPDGTYTKKPPSYEPVCAQVLLMKRAVEAAQQQSAAAPQEKRSLWEKLFHRKGR